MKKAVILALFLGSIVAVVAYLALSEQSAADRPQEPAPPYPYYSEEVTFRNEQARITLSGTLTLPGKNGKFPAVVLITGSGPQNRDEEISGHKPFLVIADYLTRHGLAVLRYDDRGMGKSSGTFMTATTPDFATDAESAVAYLKTRKEIHQDKIGLAGHSEGGLVAAIAGSRSPDIAFVISLAGPVLPALMSLSFKTSLSRVPAAWMTQVLQLLKRPAAKLPKYYVAHLTRPCCMRDLPNMPSRIYRITPVR